ncbi:MAG: sugar ABC transporter permease, partial [Bordetella sp.]|nr:sugar ABC transporter permease [Bordetella sp.]
MQPSRTAPLVYLGPAGIIMAAACLYPLIGALQLGLYDWQIGTPWHAARWTGFAHYARMVHDPAVWHALAVTLLFAVVCVGAEMLIGLALALALETHAQRPLRGTAVFRTLFILPMMVAPIAVGLIWRYLFDAQFGPFNAVLEAFGLPGIAWLADERLAFAAIVIADIWQWTPFVFIMMTAALANLDTSVLEAARIDGANGWQTTLRVKLPMIRNVIVVTLLMRMIDAFRVLEVIYILTFG